MVFDLSPHFVVLISMWELQFFVTFFVTLDLDSGVADCPVLSLLYE